MPELTRVLAESGTLKRHHYVNLFFGERRLVSIQVQDSVLLRLNIILKGPKFFEIFQIVDRCGGRIETSVTRSISQ
jgi:predicted DNA-binding antitoxin AbrB/MazE fold protein